MCVCVCVYRSFLENIIKPSACQPYLDICISKGHSETYDRNIKIIIESIKTKNFIAFKYNMLKMFSRFFI